MGQNVMCPSRLTTTANKLAEYYDHLAELLSNPQTSKKEKLDYQAQRDEIYSYLYVEKYYDQTHNDCLPCKGSCKECMSPESDICYDCENFYSTKTKHCVDTCPSDFYPDLNFDATESQGREKYYVGKKACHPCHESCRTCTGGSNNKDECLTCDGAWYRKETCYKEEIEIHLQENLLANAVIEKKPRFYKMPIPDFKIKLTSATKKNEKIYQWSE